MSTLWIKMNCVLLADRHHGLSEGIRGLLESMFGQVFMVADPSSLTEGAERLQPQVIVADLSLAQGDSEGLLRTLRDRAPEAKLVLLTVHDEPAITASVLAAGADRVILKRSIATDLLPAIDALLAGQHLDSPAVINSR